MKIYDNIIQGSEEWFKLRLGRVTASRFSDAIAEGKGISKHKLINKLVYERIHNRPFPEKFKGTDVMQRGTELEEEARNYFAELNQVEIRQVGFVELNEDIGCSPDGLIGNDGLVEIKCPDTSTHMDYIVANKFPTTYKTQVRGLLWVTGRKWCDFISYDPRYSDQPCFFVRVMRDEKKIKELHIKIQMFIDEMNKMMEILTRSPF